MTCESEQFIGQAEILPVLASLSLWHKMCTNRLVICFIDNESAKEVLTSGSSPVLSSSVMLQAFEKLEQRYNIDVWFSRVPSESNISDDASRLSFGPLSEAGFVEDKLGSCWPLSQGDLVDWDSSCDARQLGVVQVFQ